MTGVSSKGEFHEIAQSAFEALLAGVAPIGEIHLRNQCASEGILTRVSSEGEFHEITQSASQVLLTGVTPTREIHLEKQCASEGTLKGVSSEGEFHGGALKRAGPPTATSAATLRAPDATITLTLPFPLFVFYTLVFFHA